MEKKNKRNVGAMITGTILTGALLSVGNVNAANLFEFEDLGSGADLRSDLLDDSINGLKSFEATCGEKEGKAAEHKCGEGKCGEGKCGEEKKADKAEKAGKAVKADAKGKEAMKPKKEAEKGAAKKSTAKDNG